MPESPLGSAAVPAALVPMKLPWMTVPVAGELPLATKMPVLLLWSDSDPRYPLAIAEEALPLLPDGQLRVLAGTGFLAAYDDPVALARELAAFCG